MSAPPTLAVSLAAVIIGAVLSALVLGTFGAMVAAALVTPAELSRANRDLGVCEAVRYDCEAALDDARAAVEGYESRLLPGVDSPGFPASARRGRLR